MKTTRHHSPAHWMAMPSLFLTSAFLNAAPFDRPWIADVHRHNQGEWRLQVSNPLEGVCSLQASDDLQSWQTVDFTTVQSQLVWLTDADTAKRSHRFYRARIDQAATVSMTNYHGWSNSIVLANGLVEAIIVPAIGRVMQFRFASDEDGPFWENASMFGRAPTANSWDTPGSFGGDKTWPAPQSLWNWPPPRAFDSLPAEAAVTNGTVWLTSPVDARLGLRARRRIELQPGDPVMRITTTYEKMAAANYPTNRVSVWIITQLKEGERVFMPRPPDSIFANGFINLGGSLPPNWVASDRLISFTRNPAASHKVGNDAGSLLWVGTNLCLRIDSPRVPGVPRQGYPDGGCSVEIYTNPNPAAYIELEVLGPIQSLELGEQTERTAIYTLFRRGTADVWTEAEVLLPHIQDR
jgi:hypothetical protein